MPNPTNDSETQWWLGYSWAFVSINTSNNPIVKNDTFTVGQMGSIGKRKEIGSEKRDETEREK